MPKLTKPELAKFKELLLRHRALVTGDVTEMKKEALKTTVQGAVASRVVMWQACVWVPGTPGR